jgi:hypothetical protein
MPSALAAEPPEILEALQAYLEVKAMEQRAEAMRQRLRENLGG